MKPWILIYFILLCFITFLGYLFAPDYLSDYLSRTISTAEYHLLPTHKRFKLGLYTINPISNEFNEYKGVSSLIGFKSQYFLEFISWGDQGRFLDQKYHQYINELGVMPIITWEPWKRDFENPSELQVEYSLASISEGFHDEYIKQFALNLKSIKSEVVLRFAHEMNTIPEYPVWYPWQGDPSRYKTAFKRIVDIFREQGADNIKFMWNPIYFTEAASPDLYYPGDEYVDIVGFTVINLGDIEGKNGEDYDWTDCSVLLDTQYNILSKYSKEMMITELLSNEIGGNKAIWYRNCFESLEDKPEISTIITVQIDDTYEYTHNAVDWRVNSSRGALKEFTSQLQRLNN